MVTAESVTRAVIVHLAPREVPALETYLQAYRADPGMIRHLDGRTSDEATGFGGLAEAITPYVLPIAEAAVAFIAASAGEALLVESGTRVKRWVSRRFRRESPTITAVEAARVAALSPEQLQLVRDAAYRQARAMRLAESTANTLADAVVGSLVTGSE